MKNLFWAMLAFCFFAIMGIIVYPVPEGERLFTPATFLISQLLIAIYIRVLDIYDLLKEKSK